MFPCINCIAVLIVVALSAADQLECNLAISSTCINGEDKFFECKLIFIANLALGLLCRVCEVKHLTILGDWDSFQKNLSEPFLLDLAKNLTSQNFQSSCFPLKTMILRFFSLITLILGLFCLTTIKLGLLNHRSISRPCIQTLTC